MIRNEDNEKLRRRGRTSICRSTVLNLGINNPRVVVVPATNKRLGKKMPQKRPRRAYLPSRRKILGLLRKCFPLNAGGNICPDYERFERAFRKVALTGAIDGEVKICGTPLRWIAHALGSSYCDSGGGDRCCVITQLQSLDDIFMKNGTTSNYLSEFILMDVILNRKVTPTAAATDTGNHTTVNATTGRGTTTAVAFDPDAVVMASAYGCEDLDDENDYKYRTLLAFLPGAGVFYCSREWRRKSEGIEGSEIALDMSWLRIRPIELTEFRLQFGEDGYVKRFSSESKMMVSAWRVSYNPAPPTYSRVVFTSTQCADHEGPRMPPDLVVGHDLGAWPVADRAQEYNRRLANSNSARVGGRHYAAGCLYLNIPETCWIIDPMVHPFVDIIVDIVPTGCQQAVVGRKSVVMVRSILDASHKSRYCCDVDGQGLIGSLKALGEHNSLLRRQVPVGTVRHNAGDVGAMHAIGTRVLLDGTTTTGYTANCKVPQPVLRSFVEAFATVGLCCFPDVLSVVQNMEADTSLAPIAPMDGNGVGLRVGYTIDVSVNLGNSSHFDTNDASQGFSVWTEEKPGCASNWYFVLPNLHGRRLCGAEYNGVVIKLYHGTAISWDGRVIRHCTSVSRPDGADSAPVSAGSWTSVNHLFGTFTAAKEKVVAAGRASAAGNQNRHDVSPDSNE
jgi:hypothetical protein